MGKKYIIELEDKPFHKGNGDFLYRVKGFNSLVFDMTGIGMLTPYTEPDLERVKKTAHDDGYSEGYQAGREDLNRVMSDVEQVRKEAYAEGFKDGQYAEKNGLVANYAQVHKIKVGDEVENTQTGVKFIVTHIWFNNHGEKGVSGFNHNCSAFSTTIELVKKTGRHFPEIAAVLEKMRGENND